MTVGVNGPVALVAKAPVGDDEVTIAATGAIGRAATPATCTWKEMGADTTPAAHGLRRGDERERRRRPGPERPPVVRERRAVEVARAPGVLPVGSACADARVGRRGRRVADRRGEPVEHRPRLAREVAREERLRVPRGPGEAEAVARPAGARPVVAERVDLGRHELLHQVDGDERPPERRAPLPRRVGERASCVRRRTRSPCRRLPRRRGRADPSAGGSRRARHAGSSAAAPGAA